MQATHIRALGVLLLAIHAATWGQPTTSLPPSSILPSDGYVHTFWGPDEGLPSADAWPIIQDRIGYVWIGTGFGLVRFDGVRFTTFHSRNTPAFHGQQVAAIHEDTRGRIWVGIYSGGLLIYDHGTFTAPPFASALSRETVSGIFADSAGNTYVCTPVGSYVVRAGADTAARITGLKDPPHSGVTHPDGTVYFIGNGITRYDAGGAPSNLNVTSPAPYAISDILFGDDGRFYVVRLGEVRQYAFLPDGQARLDAVYPCPGAVKILKDGDRGYFIGTVGYGVVYFDGTTFTRPQGLGVQRGAGRQVHSMMHGRDGGLWVTTAGGLYQFRRTFFTIIGADAGLTNEYSWLVHLQKNGPLWIGVGNAGAYRYEGSSARLLKRADGLPDDHLTDMFESADGRMWFGGVNGELSVYDGRAFRRYGTAGASTRGRIQSISEDAQHRIWIGTRAGVFTVDGNHIAPALLADGTQIPTSRHLVHMEDGSLWCVAGGTVVHVAKGVLRSYPSTPDSGFYGTTAMLVDSGRVWFGTYGSGLYVIIRDSVINVNKACPGLGPRIIDITEDDLGYLWINAERELQRVRKTDLVRAIADTTRPVAIDVFDHRDGLRDLEFNMASAHSVQKLPDGRILYATTSGIVAVDPSAVARPTTPPPLVIERVIADDVPYAGTDAVSLPAGTRRIQIEFSALRFESPGRAMFRYRLHGVDEEWIMVSGSERTATYTNVGPGDLLFSLEASLNGGRWSATPLRLRLSIAPYFFERLWVQIAGGIALLGMILGAYRWRTRRVRERNRQLEEEVQRRVEAEAAIRSSLDEKTVMLQEIHHRVKNNMQIISSLFSLQLGNSQDPMVQEMLKESQARIRSMALVHEALYRNNNLAEINFQNYLRELAEQIAKAHHRKDVRIDFRGGPITLSLDQAIPAGLVMNETLSNAYKHAFSPEAGGTITVVTQQDGEGYAELVVSDTGRGLPEGFNPDTVPSLGFHLITALTEQLNGTLSIDGKQGTTIRVRFPTE